MIPLVASFDWIHPFHKLIIHLGLRIRLPKEFNSAINFIFLLDRPFVRAFANVLLFL